MRGGVVVAAYYFIRYAFDFVFHLVVGFAHEALDGVDGAFGVCDCLALCGIADFAFASVDECHYGGVVLRPSLLGMTTGSLPSRTATQELVVPRSIPIILPMIVSVF